MLHRRCRQDTFREYVYAVAEGIIGSIVAATIIALYVLGLHETAVIISTVFISVTGLITALWFLPVLSVPRVVVCRGITCLGMTISSVRRVGDELAVKLSLMNCSGHALLITPQALGADGDVRGLGWIVLMPGETAEVELRVPGHVAEISLAGARLEIPRLELALRRPRGTHGAVQG